MRVPLALVFWAVATTAAADDLILSLKHIEPSVVADGLQRLKSPDGAVVVTAGSNQILINDTADRIERIKRYIEAVDKPVKQVLIEARIVEASDEFSRSLGINWGVHSTNGGGKFPSINTSDTSFGGLATITAPTSGVSGLSGLASDVAFGMIGPNVQVNMRINAAANAGIARVVSAPKVLVLSGKTAKVLQGQDVAYTTATSDKIETKFIEAGLSLEVVPVVKEDGKIALQVSAKNDAPGEVPVGMVTPPSIWRKQASTDLVLADGQTLVMGGITVSRDNQADDGVPWLMDIPVLGSLFKSKSSTRSRTEMLVLITPHIIDQEAK